jgi:hypothetical protein
VIFGREGGASAGAAVFGDVITLLQPGYAHTLAEKRREELHREEVGEAGPPLIDLDAGVIRLAVARPRTPSAGEAEASDPR